MTQLYRCVPEEFPALVPLLPNVAVLRSDLLMNESK
jgi:hypothetical protein